MLETKEIFNCSVSKEDVKDLKGQGFLVDKRNSKFNARVITRNGKITSKEMKVIATAAEKFGNGEVTFTTRLTCEVQGISFSDTQKFKDYIKSEANLIVGGTGPVVRPITACKGTTCHFGLIDTNSLSLRIHNMFYIGYHDVKLPHKFKIAVGGCPNNCLKPNLNDFGIVGQFVPHVDTDLCRGCKKCSVEEACPINSAKVVNGKLSFGDSCINCGRCVNHCHFNAVTKGEKAYKIYVGGRFGKEYRVAKPLNKLLYSEEQVLDYVEKGILIFKKYGIKGERFSSTIERLGSNKTNQLFEESIILDEKDQILSSL